ncbi:DUF805 domain-containing protein [Stackebrandtia albiflava]
MKRFFKKYATFSGRASRSEYWWVALLNGLILVGGSILATIIQAATAGTNRYGGVDDELTFPAGLLMFLLMLYLLGTIVPNLALGFRRLHDADLSGWFILLGMVPGCGGFIMLILTLQPTRPAGVRFDRNPGR